MVAKNAASIRCVRITSPHHRAAGGDFSFRHVGGSACMWLLFCVYGGVMTYVGSVEVFRCDVCGCSAQTKSGLPSGWIWVKTGGPVNHACPSCRDKVPKDKQRESGQLN